MAGIIIHSNLLFSPLDIDLADCTVKLTATSAATKGISAAQAIATPKVHVAEPLMLEHLNIH